MYYAQYFSRRNECPCPSIPKSTLIWLLIIMHSRPLISLTEFGRLILACRPPTGWGPLKRIGQLFLNYYFFINRRANHSCRPFRWRGFNMFAVSSSLMDFPEPRPIEWNYFYYHRPFTSKGVCDYSWEMPPILRKLGHSISSDSNSMVWSWVPGATYTWSSVWDHRSRSSPSDLISGHEG